MHRVIIVRLDAATTSCFGCKGSLPPRSFDSPAISTSPVVAAAANSHGLHTRSLILSSRHLVITSIWAFLFPSLSDYGCGRGCPANFTQFGNASFLALVLHLGLPLIHGGMSHGCLVHLSVTLRAKRPPSITLLRFRTEVPSTSKVSARPSSSRNHRNWITARASLIPCSSSGPAVSAMSSSPTLLLNT